MLLKRKFIRGHPLINNFWLKQKENRKVRWGTPLIIRWNLKIQRWVNSSIQSKWYKLLLFKSPILAIRHIKLYMFSGSNKQFSKVFRYSVWPECMTRPRYCCLFSTTPKNFFFAKFALRECLVRNTKEVNTFVLGHQHGQIDVIWK